MGKVKEACHQITAGGTAGLVEVSIMQPLDVIKTRFQLQGSSNSNMQYTGMWDCVKQMIKKEGALSLYKGILPPIMADTPKRATKFFTFEQFKGLFLFGSPVPTPVTYSLAGLCSGLAEGVLINPFEVVKVRLQADQNTFKKQQSAYSMARHIIRTDGLGLAGMCRGLTATLCRHGIFNMCYFGFYHNVKNYFPAPQDHRLALGRRFLIGLIAGCSGSAINIPFDVAKSRIQGPQPVPGEIKYHGCFRTIAMVYREEGYFALYRGLVPKMMRLGPGGAIMLLVYDYVYNWLKENT